MMGAIRACIDGSPETAAVCDLGIWAATKLDRPLTFAVVSHSGESSVATAGFGDEPQRLSQMSMLHALAAVEVRRRELVASYADALLHAAQDYVGAAASVVVENPALVGNLASIIAGAANTLLLIVGRHQLLDDPGHPAPDAVPGRYLAALSSPMLVVDADCQHRPRHMAVAFDGRLTGRSMIERLCQLRIACDMRVSVIMAAAPTAPMQAQAAWATAQLMEAGVAAQTMLWPGLPLNVIADFVRQNEVDLLVLGGYHYSNLRSNVMGSTMTNVIRSVKTPTLVMR
jgi:nucleotide-binding universal stress UspA family protein